MATAVSLYISLSIRRRSRRKSCRRRLFLLVSSVNLDIDISFGIVSSPPRAVL